MKFNPIELELCAELFREGKSTAKVQEYLMNKYNIKRSSTSNFVKLIRKRLGIYNSKYK